MTNLDLLTEYRWPAAVVLSSLVLAVMAVKLLSWTIPIAIKGGLQFDNLVPPPYVTIRSLTSLSVVVQEQVMVSGNTPLVVEGAVSVAADDPLAVRSDVFVDNEVTIGGKVDIQGKVKPTLLPVPRL